MSTLTRTCLNAARGNVQRSIRYTRTLRIKLSPVSSQSSYSRSSLSMVAPFSTMQPLRSSDPAPGAPREYDSEIKDMASYVHNYKIDSDLAVSQSWENPYGTFN